MGDMHNMESLVKYDLLPRLFDAAMSRSSPEIHIIQTWRDRLSAARLDAEDFLGNSPADLRRHWQTKGNGSEHLYDVERFGEEWEAVSSIFKSQPREAPTYQGPTNPSHTKIAKIQRVENSSLQSHSCQPYFESLRESLSEQGVDMEPGVHTRWAFHGTAAVDSIINDPITGFQPLTSGARLGSLWGSGTYFARDASYVIDSNFCQPCPDGSKRMLLCLLATGIPCQGDPNHHGVLPVRQHPHHYNSSVDSLSSPEIFVTQHPAAAYPAYVVTFY
jgi:hypothetical protein